MGSYPCHNIVRLFLVLGLFNVLQMLGMFSEVTRAGDVFVPLFRRKNREWEHKWEASTRDPMEIKQNQNFSVRVIEK